MRIVYAILSLVLLAGCAGESGADFEHFAEVQIEALSGEKVVAGDLLLGDKLVLLFLSPECPLCRKYVAEMRRLREDFDDRVDFYAIFSGKWYSELSIEKFLSENQLEYNALLDPDYKLSGLLGAKVTPEAFLLDENGRTIYKGAIDNWAYEVGRTRPAATAFYLRDAIQAGLLNAEISLPQTEAVGCLIE